MFTSAGFVNTLHSHTSQTYNINKTQKDAIIVLASDMFLLAAMLQSCLFMRTFFCLFFCLQDMQLWEDLCQLEGQLGMRYLTHESEDNFWMKHGARPHPLAKQEAEQKAAELAAAAIADNQRVVKFSDMQGTISNGTSRSGLAATMTNADSTVVAADDDNATDNASTNSNDSRDRASSSGSKKDYLNMTDEEISASEAHATRVGYKVTTI